MCARQCGRAVWRKSVTQQSVRPIFARIPAVAGCRASLFEVQTPSAKPKVWSRMADPRLCIRGFGRHDAPGVFENGNPHYNTPKKTSGSSLVPQTHCVFFHELQPHEKIPPSPHRWRQRHFPRSFLIATLGPGYLVNDIRLFSWKPVEWRTMCFLLIQRGGQKTPLLWVERQWFGQMCVTIRAARSGETK